MATIAVIISIIALVGAGFAFIRANSSHNILSKRIEALKDRNNLLEAKLRKLEGNSGRSNKPVSESVEGGRRNQPRQEQPEPKQNQPRQETSQNEPRQKQPRSEQQQDLRQKQRERQQQQQLQNQPQAAPAVQQNQDAPPQQPRRKKENRRRNEPMERNNYDEIGREQPLSAAKPTKLEFAGGDLLDELEQAAAMTISNAAPVEAPYTGKKFSIIPEDGVIRMHQLQQQPDSDSYLEVDPAIEGSSTTNYRFNLAGNHAFVIAQGIERLENAFDFEKPSNRMVSRVVQQHDGVLTKVNNGWKIIEKARIDFR